MSDSGYEASSEEVSGSDEDLVGGSQNDINGEYYEDEEEEDSETVCGGVDDRSID